MELNRSTGLVLRYGAYVGIAVMALGAIVLQFSGSLGDEIIFFGVGILILTPLLSIIISAVALYLDRDFKWFRIAECLLLITMVGIVVAFFV